MYFLFGRVWFDFSTSDAWSRSISFTSGVAVIFLVFLVGKELFSRQVGLWGALLAAFSPLLVAYSRDATCYSWLTAVSLLGLYLLARSLIRGGWPSWILFMIVTTIAIFTHLFSFVLVLAYAGVYFILRDRNRKTLAPFLTSQLTFVVAIIISLLISNNANGLINIKLPLKVLLVKLAIIPYVLLGGGFNDFGAGIGSTIYNHVRSGRRMVETVTLLLLIILPLFVIFLIRKTALSTFLSKRSIALIFYTVVLTVIPVIIHNVLDVPDQPSQRFYLWATPTFLLLVALFIVSLSSWWKMITGAILIAGMSAMSIWGVFFYQAADFKTPLTFVSDKYQSGDLLFCYPYEIGFLASGHYYPESLHMAGLFLPPEAPHPGEYYYLPSHNDVYALIANNYKTIDKKYLSSGEDLKRSAQDSIKDTDRVWVILYFDHDQHEYCIGCDVLNSVFSEGWQEESWSFNSGNVHLFTRRVAAADNQDYLN